YMDECKQVRQTEQDELSRAFLEFQNSTDDSLLEAAKVNDKLTESFTKLENCFIGFLEKQQRHKPMDYVDSVMYAITVFTTVGYGDVVANTILSKFLTMLYALFGIPLYIAFISDLGDFIGIKIVHFGQFIRNCIERCKKKRRLTDEERLKQLPQLLRFSLITISFFVFVILAMVMTKYVEEWIQPDMKWSFIDSLYFVFTSIALIGFGDIVANHYSYICILFPFLIVGQTLAALMFYFAQRFIRYEIPHLVTNACLKMTGRVEGWISGNPPAGSRLESETEQPLVEFEAPGALCVKMDEVDENPKDAGGKDSKECISNVSKPSPAANIETPSPMDLPTTAEVTSTNPPTPGPSNDAKVDLNTTAKPKTIADMFMPCHPGVPEDHSDTISVFAKYRARSSPSTCQTEEKTQIQRKTHVIKK
uniref:Potassium channel domain-containing protein n=1 Tax=Panagrolaimus sp. JU765 TaxID=591449 RepID=A0AC34RCD8_9BILA